MSSASEFPAEAGAAGDPEPVVPGRFASRTAIVTGAGSGIGRATAVRLAREGARAAATSTTPGTPAWSPGSRFCPC